MLYNVIVGVVEYRILRSYISAHVVREGRPYGKTFVLVNPQTVPLHTNVHLQLVLDCKKILFGLLSLGQFAVQLLNVRVDCSHLLDNLDMGRIVAILILRSVAPLLKTRLRHLKWGPLSSNGRLQILNEGVLLLDFF